MTTATPEVGDLPFTYDQFKVWYDTLRLRQLEPALNSVRRYLTEMLEDGLSDFDRSRIQLGPGRVKSPARTWAKLNQEKYRGKVHRFDDIPDVLDDLVGIRIVCNNTSDISAVQLILSSLPEVDEDEKAVVAFESDKERTYHQKPKPSGYRAYHANLSANIGSGVEHRWNRVSVELQVRTLLQDGWGELTHEDTYKPGAPLPPLIQTLARRMANLLSCVDELAQDIRDELDRLASPQIEAPLVSERKNDNDEEPRTLHAVNSGPSPIPSEHMLPDAGFPEQALLEETRLIVRGLTKPETLANIAYRLQALFGNSVSQEHWGRFGTFKALLVEAVPEVRIEYVGPSWVVPPGFTLDDLPAASSFKEFGDEQIPAVMKELRTYERNIPAVPQDYLRKYLNSAAAALDPDLWAELGFEKSSVGIQQVNTLSKAIRDRITNSGGTISRPKLGYILTALLYTGNLRPGIDIEDIRAILRSYLMGRMQHHNIELDEDAFSSMDDWIEWG